MLKQSQIYLNSLIFAIFTKMKYFWNQNFIFGHVSVERIQRGKKSAFKHSALRHSVFELTTVTIEK